MIDAQQKRAQPLVAASYAYLKDLKQPLSNSQLARLPKDITHSDFNFLDPNSQLAKADGVLISASQFMGKDEKAYMNPIAESAATVFGDNGAFRIISDQDYYKDKQTAVDILKWMEANCHVGPMLDIPTAAIGKNPNFPTFKSTLDAYLLNADAMLTARDKTSKMLLLNVMQGRTVDEFKRWYHAVKHFDTDGWAIGGDRRLCFASIIWFLHQLNTDNQLKEMKWLHVFGTFRFEMILGMTQIKRAVEAITGCPITVTTDASTAMTILYERFGAYSGYHRNGDRLPVQQQTLPTHQRPAKSNEPFPYPGSAVSQLFKINSLCINRGAYEKVYSWDNLSRLIAVNHNIDFVLSAVDNLHHIMEKGGCGARKTIPAWILDLSGQAKDILKSKDPGFELKKRAHHLCKLVKTDYR